MKKHYEEHLGKVHKDGWRHQLRWRHTHREPPNGLPKVLGEWTDREPTTEDFLGTRWNNFPRGGGMNQLKPLVRGMLELEELGYRFERTATPKHISDKGMRCFYVYYQQDENPVFGVPANGMGEACDMADSHYRRLLNRPITSVRALAKGFTLTTNLSTESTTCTNNLIRT